MKIKKSMETRNGHYIFMIKISKSYILIFSTALDYNQAISHEILSQIFDTARIAYCILSDQYTDNSSCLFFYGSDRPRRDRKLRFFNKKQYVGF